MSAIAQSSSATGILKSEFVFASRLVPFAECHASTIAESGDHFVAAWFGGTGEGHPDVGIWLSLNHAGSWTEPTEVATGQKSDGNPLPCWNPVLFQPKSGPLLLFYKEGPNPRQWWGMMMTSGNGGRTWSVPRRLPDGILGPIKNKPVQCANGDILCPSSTEDGGWHIHFERTRDGGETWSKTPPVEGELSAIQPTILFHAGIRLQALGRTRQGKIFQTWSDDQGATWSPMTPTPLPNPNSGIDAVTLSDGRQLLVYNHTTKSRSPLNLAVSRDGVQWDAALVLESGPGEFSYPAVIQARDGLVHVTYTWKRRSIRHVVLDPSRLALRSIQAGAWPK
jgi:predicted neuraminidase